jgi:hypothetical protein
MVKLLTGALGLAARRIPVISLRPRTKIPLHNRWTQLGMLDAAAIVVEWRVNPSANVGVLCGPDALDGDGLVIVDIDQPDGSGTLAELEREHGPLPITSTVLTPSGGQHRYFRGRADSWNPGRGLEVRSTGRQCAAPPSLLHVGGYRWTDPAGLGELVQLPAWLASRPAQPSPRRVMTGRLGAACDPVLTIAPPLYFARLTGLVPDAAGFVSCPFHRDDEPSLKVYPSAEQGWFCYGEECRKGGDVVTLAAHLAGLTPPLRAYQFVACLDYLRGRLL